MEVALETRKHGALQLPRFHQYPLIVVLACTNYRVTVGEGARPSRLAPSSWLLSLEGTLHYHNHPSQSGVRDSVVVLSSVLAAQFSPSLTNFME